MTLVFPVVLMAVNETKREASILYLIQRITNGSLYIFLSQDQVKCRNKTVKHMIVLTDKLPERLKWG